MRAEGGYVGFHAGLEVNNAQRLERIYEVQSIMQFAHSALFRLCEAQRNGDLRDREFSKLFESTLSNAQALLVAADLSSAVREMSDLMLHLDVEREKLKTMEEGGERTIRSIKAKICDQFIDDSDSAKCQVHLAEWARGVLEMDIGELEKKPPYDHQVKELFESKELKMGKGFNLDFIELMTLVKAYSARNKARKMIAQNAMKVDAARLGLAAVAKLVPGASHAEKEDCKASPEGKSKEAPEKDATPSDPPAEQGKEGPAHDGSKGEANHGKGN